MIRSFLLAGLLAPGTLVAQAARVTPQLRPFIVYDDAVMALVNARVVDGTGRTAREAQTVVIANGTITAVGPAGTVAVPPAARRIDLTGKTVLPGMIMLHEHMFYPAGQGAYNQLEYSFPRLYLAGGATTIRTGGSRDPYGDLNLKRAIDAGQVPGPTMDVTGPYLNGPGLGINFVHALSGPDEARAHVRYWADRGATSFKAYMHISRDELRAAVEEAHARGLKVTGHLCSVTYREAAEIGIDNLEHGLFAATDFVPGKQPDECPNGGARTRSLDTLDPDGPEARRLIEYLVAHGVALTSTLTVFETSVPSRPVAYDAALDAMAPQAREQYLRRWSSIQSATASTGQERFRIGMAFEHAFAQAGGLLVAGTDPTGYGGVVAGFANQREVELLVEAGFSPVEAIRVATANGARYLGIEDRVGTVEVGKAADLMIVAGNPAAQIADIRRVEIVFKAGLGYDSARLIESARELVGYR